MRFFSGLAAGLLLVLLCSGEEPSFSVGFPTWGMTPRLCAYQWCRVPFEVSNPNDEPVEVIFAIRAANQAEALYSKTVTLGPHASMRDSLSMISEETEDYHATLSHADGRLISNQSIISNFQNMHQTVPAFFCSDDPELSGVSALPRNKNLGRRMLVTRSPAEDMPVHLTGFGGAMMLALVKPDFARMSASQLDAIEKFVASGGTLVVLGKEAILDVEQTPLQSLMPVVPLGSRRIGTFPELGEWADVRGGNTGPVWEDGIDFVEVEPKPDTTASLSLGRFPAICWGHYQLGRVVAVSFNPFVEGCRDTLYGDAVWKHLLSGTGYQPLGSMALYDGGLDQAVARLIGFKVPSADVIRNILVRYFILVGAIFLLGHAVKKQVASWSLCTACSLVLTFFVLAAAGRQLDQQDRKNAIILDLACQTSVPGEGVFCGEKMINLINREDDRPDILGRDGDTWMRPSAPEPTLVSASRNVNMMVSIFREDGRSQMRRLDVHENKTVKIFARYEGSQGPQVEPFSLVFSEGGMQLWGKDLPEEVATDNLKAYLLLGQDFRRINVKNRKLTLADNSGGTLDPVVKDFEDYLRDARLPAPSVCLFYQTPTPCDDLVFGDGSYQQQRHMLHLVPVLPQLGSGTIHVPAEAVLLEPSGKGARGLRWKNEWQDAFLYDDRSSYLFSAQLPLKYRGLCISEASIRLAIHNTSNQVKASAELVPLDEAGQARSGSKGIQPLRTEGETLIFAGLDQHRFVNPVDGKVLVRLTLAREISDKSAPPSKAGGKWRMAEFAVDFTGAVQ